MFHIMNTVRKLFLLTVLFCPVYCELYEYQLPDHNEVKSLNVFIYYQHGYQSNSIYCNNYNSLKYLDLRTGDRHTPYELKSNSFIFYNCFNNETNNENYSFNLMNIVQKYIKHDAYRIDSDWARQSIVISIVPYALVNSDALFGNDFFNRYSIVYLNHVGFTNDTNFLNTIQCRRCNFEHINQLNFNSFNETLNMKFLYISNSKIVNFSSDNLQKLNSLTELRINLFSLDNYNTFNVPGLFVHQNALKELYLTKSNEKIWLHDDVFRGLRNIVYISLEHLHLGSIPPRLFDDLEKVKYIKLNFNNIKVLHSTLFEFNVNLKNVQLKANPIFSEPHDTIDQFVIGAYLVNFDFENYTIHTRNTVRTLINNQNIRKLYFESLETDFKIQDFMDMEFNRSSDYLSIEFKRYPSGHLDWGYLNKYGIAHQESMNVRRDLNENFTQIILPISEEACQNCWMIKKFFHAFLRLFEPPAFYFESSRTLLEFVNDCPNQQQYFDEEYTTNCLSACTCKHNPLTDKITIDCRNRIFTEFPVITYPVQFADDKIYKIDLLFENNLVHQISFDGQDERVLSKLATLNFSNNPIISFTMMDNEFNNVDRLDLCTTPLINDRRVVLQLSSNAYGYDKEFCSHENRDSESRMEPNEYIFKTKSADFINHYLNKLNCE